jgi:hypothetical protein
MPGKSKRGKGKHPHYHRKSKIRQRQDRAGLPQPVAGDVPKPGVPIVAKSSPAPKAAPKGAASAAASTIYQRDYTLGELKRIGILTGIIFVILIVLYFILS